MTGRHRTGTPRTLLLDLGTTWVKSAVTSGRGIEPRPPRPTSELADATADDDATWSAAAVRGTVATLLDRESRGPEPIRALRLSTHMRGFAIEDGDRPTRYLTWQAGHASRPVRGRTPFARLAARIPPAAMARTGTWLRPDSPLANAHALAHAAGRAPRGRFHTLGSLVLDQLSGEHVTHVTCAAATGLYDLVEARWSDDLIGWAGLSELVFPRVVHDLTPVGTCRRTGVVLHPDLGDNQAAVLGAGVTDRTGIVVAAGTAGLVSRPADDRDQIAGTELRPHLNGGYLRVVSGLPTGQTVVDDPGERTARRFAAAVELLNPARDATRLVVTGGAARRRPAFGQTLYRLTGLPVRHNQAHDHALLGLARLAEPAALGAGRA
ncbi:FGGY family carbohydrate kinase [Jiangella alba]|uniref:Xylulokinase n=1 Tax=Jiangella alba TaxID=561176 RepID=A0A1H5LCP9_9ACTN|nr:FGGY family carbohydrate kinase [Jiangella alba]SEE74819.1 xylulokinase [Jiangella alba]